MATSTPTATPAAQKRTPWTIPSRASDLPDEQLAKYIDLICDGSPEAIAIATALHGRAKHDSLEIEDCRVALRLFTDASNPGPQRKLGQAQDKLETVRDEIARLQELETAIETEVAQAERDAPNSHQFRRRLGIICTNKIVRMALKSELEAAGV
jgi:hypothetical protein